MFFTRPTKPVNMRLMWSIILLFGLLSALFEPTSAEKGYLLTAPEVLSSGSLQRLCLVLTEISGPGKVTVKLLRHKVDVSISEKVLTYPRDEQCFDLEIPNTKYSEGRLHLKGEFPSDNYTFESYANVTMESKLPSTFVQTDKATYKPGETVLFRVLTVNNEFEPVPKSISKVYIENPDGIRVAQWLNVDDSLGLAQMNLTLIDEAALGKWKINVLANGKVKTQSFDVKEYVLPKFEVKIVPPKYILPTWNEITYQVCAKYTYGKPVVGNLTASVIYKGYFWGKYRDNTPETHHKLEINGCQNVTIDVQTMKWNESWNEAFQFKRLNIFAEVEEIGTKIKFQDSHDMYFSHQAFNLRFKSTENSNYNKPGLTYHDQVYVKDLDDKPMEGELINLCFTDDANQMQFCKNFTSNKDGIVDFVIPSTEPTAESIKIRAWAINAAQIKYSGYGPLLYQPEAYKSLSTWHSPSGSFINIHPIHSQLECGSNVNLVVDYTTDGEDIDIHYQVISRGKIVKDGMKKHQFVGQIDQLDSFKDAEETFLNYSSDSNLKFREEVNTTLPEHVGQFQLDLTVIPEMSPVVRVLVFYIRPDGEVVSASTVLNVDRCFKNKVSLKFDESSIRPGSPARYEISASPNSLCALTGVDKSSRLLKSGNQLTKDKLFHLFKSFDDVALSNAYPSNYDYCKNRLAGRVNTSEPWEVPGPIPIEPIPSDAMPVEPLPIDVPVPDPIPTLIDPVPIPMEIVSDNPIEVDVPEVERKKRSSWGGGFDYSSSYADSLYAFLEAGFKTLTNLPLENRPCKFNRYQNRVYYASSAGGAQTESFNKGASGPGSLEIRNLFPETWLWDLKIIGEDGKLREESNIPHTITEWVTSTYCISKEYGLGIAPDAAIKSFQPFFASISLPYSVVRKEKVPISVSVFNYKDSCLPVEITLEKKGSFSLSSGEYTQKKCVCGSRPWVHDFKIVPTVLGEISLVVYSHSLKDEDHSICSEDMNASSEEVRDAIHRQLLVEPEGFPQESVQSVLFCPSEGNFKHSFELELPEDYVEESARALFSVSGDIMGPSLSGLDKLVKMPYGCGEQNMIGFTPNIYVMQYLKNSNSLTNDLESRMLKNMNSGYRRELQYRHDDGSYSAFGKSDNEGSLWLTAFVVKSFAQAQKYIDIDTQDLQKSIEYLLNKQQDNGCFPFIGMVHQQDMKGGVRKGVPTALTAYTLGALLESGIPVSRNMIDLAFECINNDTDPNAYTLAISAYVASLDKQDKLARDFLEKLYEKANVESSHTYWTAASKSISVELGSYAVLALINLDTKDSGYKSKGVSIIKWIAQQRNANGGFISTQDTVMALQAFASFAPLLSGKQDLQVEAEGNSFEKTYSLNATNSILMQRNKITDLPNILDVSAAGDGCGLVQVELLYNRRNVDATDALEMTVVPTTRAWDCSTTRITVCTRYKIPDEKSNMAIVSIKMVSGYSPDKASIRQLKYQRELNLKRFEVEKNYVNFYFDYLSNEETCFTFNVERDIIVEDAKPAIATVYDYYISEFKINQEYEIPFVNCTKRIIVDDPLVLDEVPGFNSTNNSTESALFTDDIEEDELDEKSSTESTNSTTSVA